MFFVNFWLNQVQNCSNKFQNAHLQGYLFRQKLNKDTPLQVKWKSNKNLKAIEIIFLMNIYNDKW